MKKVFCLREKTSCFSTRNYGFFPLRGAKIAFLLALSLSVFSSCRSVHFNETTEVGPGRLTNGARNINDEIAADKREETRYAIEEELKEVDIEQTIIYVDRPVYTNDVETTSGKTAIDIQSQVMESLKDAKHIPITYTNGIMYYSWDDSFIYEIHTQPLRITDVELQPGEEVLEMPILSETTTWEIAAGVSKKNGLDVQHFFIKPSKAELSSSFVIITNKRVYHLLMKSFNPPTGKNPELYMSVVRWRYPADAPFNIKQSETGYSGGVSGALGANGVNTLSSGAVSVDPRFLSFDYKMNYSIFKKPLWLPRRVYDDGRKTYVLMDEKVLHSSSPVLFNKNNERINYRVQENLIIIDELIEKVTLRIGNEKVSIQKKNGYFDSRGGS
jgi:type IV secretion system protein VirB9